MRRIRNRLTYANVVATLALVIAVAGGTAYAANTVFSTDIVDGEVKTPDIASNAVGTGKIQNNQVFSDDVRDDTLAGGGLTAADLRSGSVGSAEVANSSLDLADLNAGSRAHKLEFSVPGVGGGTKTTIATVGNLRLSGDCTNFPSLHLFLENVTDKTGTMNLMLTSQQASNGPVGIASSGQFVGAGEEFTVDNNDDTSFRPLAAGSFSRVEGQLVFQTPGRVTTIDFHAFAGDPGNPRCEFYGTAVTSNLS